MSPRDSDNDSNGGSEETIQKSKTTNTRDSEEVETGDGDHSPSDELEFFDALTIQTGDESEASSILDHRVRASYESVAKVLGEIIQNQKQPMEDLIELLSQVDSDKASFTESSKEYNNAPITDPNTGTIHQPSNSSPFDTAVQEAFACLHQGQWQTIPRVMDDVIRASSAEYVKDKQANSDDLYQENTASWKALSETIKNAIDELEKAGFTDLSEPLSQQYDETTALVKKADDLRSTLYSDLPVELQNRPETEKLRWLIWGPRDG